MGLACERTDTKTARVVWAGYEEGRRVQGHGVVCSREGSHPCIQAVRESALRNVSVGDRRADRVFGLSGLLRSCTTFACVGLNQHLSSGLKSSSSQLDVSCMCTVAGRIPLNTVHPRVGQVPDPRFCDPRSSAVIQPLQALQQRGSRSCAVLYGLRLGAELCAPFAAGASVRGSWVVVDGNVSLDEC